MNTINDFHPRSFEIASTESDLDYYHKHPSPSLLDAGGQKAVEALYHTLIQESDIIVDLMCGLNSHIPTDIPYKNLIGIDINKQTLQQNQQLTQRIVQDLNDNPILPIQDDCVDFICLCAVMEYLRQPLQIFQECLRILKPAGRIVLSFSNKFLSTRTVALWQALENTDRQKLIKIFLNRAGFIHFDQGELHPPTNHPLWQASIYSVVASKPLS